MANVTMERWKSLRERRHPRDVVVEAAVTDVAGSLIGVDPEGRLHLFLVIKAEPKKLPPDLQSIEVRIVEREGMWIDVSAKWLTADFFTVLVNKILYAVHAERRDPAIAVESAIEALRASLKPVSPDLGTSEQIGLFGELWVLKNILLPSLGNRACHIWSGPHSERHDFVGHGVHLEVKATTKSDEKHEISRLDQLRAPEGKRLLLVSVRLERSIGGNLSIADLIDQIIEQLGSDGHAIDAFESSLGRVGWSNAFKNSGALLKFNLRDAHVFEVSDSFPRLPDDYTPPRGVTAIRYTIDIASRATLSVAQAKEILAFM